MGRVDAPVCAQLERCLHVLPVRSVSKNQRPLLSVSDPVVDSWFLMSSPIPVLTILGFYLYFVLKLGPQLMATRKPFNLQGLLVAYNFYQVIFSIWLCSTVSIIHWKNEGVSITLCVASQRVFVVVISLSIQSGNFWIHHRILFWVKAQIPYRKIQKLC
jgi:hypothetical protein